MGAGVQRAAVTVPRLVIGGVTSGAGKTTFTAGLIGALRRRGLRVAPFKVGPDYIDPSYHARIAGRPCRNLDSWMVPKDSLVELFARSTASADVAVVEGVMGLFDGRNGLDEDGSTAQVAKLLGAPTILMVGAAKTSRSAGATVLGFRNFDPELRLAGAILNQVGSPTHEQWVREAIETGAGVPVLGHLPRRADLVLPERHLGLVPTGEAGPGVDFFNQLVDQIEATVAVDELLALARSAAPVVVRHSGVFPDSPVEPLVRIGIAMDRAFTFYYEDNLDLLRSWGATLVPFSPLEDASLPAGLDGLYIGGGFPELFGAELAGNRTMLRAIRGFVAAGLPVYAECGGFMYLSEGIVDFENRHHPLVGVVPTWSAMTKRRLTMGYRSAVAMADSLLLRKGESVRGHEFHWSETLSPVDAGLAAYQFAERADSREGYARGQVLASYLHVHFASRPDLAPRFVAACRSAAMAGTRLPSTETYQNSTTASAVEHRASSPAPGDAIGDQDASRQERDFLPKEAISPIPAAARPIARSMGYPACLDVVDKTCVVVGGGKVAERKVHLLLEAGARIVLVSAHLTPELRRLREASLLAHIARHYVDGDLAEAFLAFAATDDRATNQAVADEARRRQVLVNTADDPARCDFTVPAVLRRGALLVAVSTNGRSPATARFVRDELETLVTPEHVTMLEMVAEVRAELRAQGRRVQSEAWHSAIDDDLLALIRRGEIGTARSKLMTRLSGETSNQPAQPV